MTQYDFGTIDTDATSGDDLAELLQNERDALNSLHKGSSRPDYAVAGLLWIDDSGTSWVLKLFDGSDDILVGTINATTNLFTASVPEATDSVAGLLSAADKEKLDGIAEGATANFPQGRVSLTDAATVTIDASAGDVFDLVAAGNRTFVAPTGSPVDGQKILIRHKASGADRTPVFTTGSAGAFRFGSDLTGVTATASGKTDHYGCVYNSSDDRWDIVAATKGF